MQNLAADLPRVQSEMRLDEGEQPYVVARLHPDGHIEVLGRIVARDVAAATTKARAIWADCGVIPWDQARHELRFAAMAMEP